MDNKIHKSWNWWFEERLNWKGRAVHGSVAETPHPIAHISTMQCYEWMRQDCAALDLARQQREDGIISTITTISSTALLAIPSLFLTKGLEFPSFADGSALYIGICLFALSIFIAIAEQMTSIGARRSQIKITQDYYLQKSELREDENAVTLIGRLRWTCLATFVAALLLSTIGLSEIRSKINVQPSTAASSSASTAASSTSSSSAASAAASATTANSAGSRRGPR